MTLRWHNSAVVSAPSRLVSTLGRWTWHNFPIQFGVYEHATLGLVLIDTGYGPSLFSSTDLLVKLYRTLLRPRLIVQGDAFSVVRSLGANARDVRHIILTHLHADHMCGLDQFPDATIYASAASLQGWTAPRDFSSLHKGFFPSLLPAIAERKVLAFENQPIVHLPWGGSGFAVVGDGSIISVDLPGHMPGHAGLFFPQLAKPILHAADADWTFDSLLKDEAVTLLAHFIVDDVAKLKHSKSLVRQALAYGCEVTLSHDVRP